jgi:syndecan 1
MKSFYCLLALALLGCAAAQRRNSNRRNGRSGARQGRQEGDLYAAPPLDTYGEEPQDVYQGAASDNVAADDNLAMLEKAVPGVPGEDYPIFAEVPESGFACDGQVDGGYYADPEAQCQVFHICTADGQGGLAKYSFLCPNGTIFNQNYFICDWWFNFDCAEAEGLYSLNEDIAAEREANTGAASDTSESYAAPSGNEPLGGYGAPEDVIDDAQAAYGQAAGRARTGRGPANFNGGRRGRNGRRANGRN